MFFLFALSFWAAVHAHLVWRLRPTLREVGVDGRITVAAVVVLALLPVVGMLPGRVFTATPLTDRLTWLGFAAMGVSSLLVTFCLFADFARLLAWLLRRFIPEARASDQAVEDPRRRRFFANVVNVGVLGGAGTLSIVGGAEAGGVPDVEEVEIPIPDLPPQFDGFHIVQLTDVHIGPTLKGDWLARVVARVNELEADLVAITGDLVDGRVPELGPQLAALARLRARESTFFVTGNHEYYWDAPAWIEELRRLGVTVLNDEHRVLARDGARLTIAGVTDLHSQRHVAEHRSDPRRAREGAPQGVVSVLLAHQPRSVFAAAEAGYDVQISGHTHGGQYFPMNFLIHLFQPFVAGLHRVGQTWLYVSRGTGYWGPPMRLGAPSEITSIRLRRATV